MTVCVCVVGTEVCTEFGALVEDRSHVDSGSDFGCDGA